MGNRAKRNLGKYDAPLVIQYRKGMDDFHKGRLSNPFHKDTMQYREWNRGFNKAYFDRLRKVKKYESKGSKDIGKRSSSVAEETALFNATR